MWNRWSGIAFALAALGAVVFLGLVVNQTAQLVSLASALDPRLGTAVAGTLLVVYAICLLVPVVLFLRLPRPLRPPATDDGRDFERHLRALGRRLARNERAGPGPFRTRDEIEAGLERLGGRADHIARRAASEVFIATAVSQHGGLDAAVMLGIQARMIWRIAHVYHQRPGARELSRLYANVGATAFIAGELEDLDIRDHIQPVVAGVFGSMAGSVPGLQTASATFVTSVLGGATNAFLTLRVAVIARRYCTALTFEPRRSVRRAAVTEAGAMLGGIVRSGTRRISQALLTASGRSISSTARSLGQQVRAAGQALADRITGADPPEAVRGGGQAAADMRVAGSARTDH